MTGRGVGKSDKLKVLSLFAGIGGFDLGLERTGGFETVAFCEQDKKCQRVLAKHWPGVPCYDDVRTLTSKQLAADGIAVDCIVGGFPCQDISTAGRGAGIHGERSGLWAEFARLIDELGPCFVIVENVSALLGRGLGTVLGGLAPIGYDAWWDCIPASSVGAPHQRDRIWIIAYPNPCRPTLERVAGKLLAPQREKAERLGFGHRGVGQALANPNGQRGRRRQTQFGGWDVEPPVGRVANGVPGRVDRLKQLGNAVVPQIPELIGNAILASLAEQREAA